MVSIASLLRRSRRTLYLYGDESGQLKSDPFFLVGLVTARDPHRHESHISRLRRDTQYQPEIKYSSTDRYKLPLVHEMLEYFWHEPDLRYFGIAVPTSKLSWSEFRKHRTRLRPQDVAYNWWYKRLIARASGPQDELVVRLDKRSRAREDNLPEYLRDEFRELTSLQLVDSKNHQLVQLADLITGAIFGDLTRVQHAVKRAPIDHLKSLAGVNRLTSWRLQDHPSFNVLWWRFSQRSEA